MVEVLLLQDVNGIGKKDDLLVVGDGYALNFLLPTAKAMIATPTVRRRYAEQIRRRAEEREAERMSQETKAATVAHKEVRFERKTTKTGKLYAAITEKHLVDELKKQHNIEIKEADITIDQPIKALGEFEVSLSLAGSQTPLTVSISELKE